MTKLVGYAYYMLLEQVLLLLDSELVDFYMKTLLMLVKSLFTKEIETD